MYKWYRTGFYIDEYGYPLPEYTDSSGCTGFSGRKMGDYYIVKIYGSKDLHEFLEEEGDIIVLSEQEVEQYMNNFFGMSRSFQEWDYSFRAN